ncbi:MAG: DUF4625 domain-containing protein [Bacteroidales bacterium]|nr:DUF4625 domain-containing protein [Bacteroidales bacterium]
MNNKIYRFAWLAILVFGLFATACSDDDPADTEAPTALIGSPVAEMVYQRGQSIIVSAGFEDNQALSHVEVSISEASELKGWDDPWEETETIELSGKSQSLSSYVLFGEAIPMEIKSGSYKLEFLVVDMELNYTKYDIALTIE